MRLVLDAGQPHYVQVGVVHGGIGDCGSKVFPGIYARLEDEENLNFIREAMGLRELNNSLRNFLITTVMALSERARNM